MPLSLRCSLVVSLCQILVVLLPYVNGDSHPDSTVPDDRLGDFLSGYGNSTLLRAITTGGSLESTSTIPTLVPTADTGTSDDLQNSTVPKNDFDADGDDDDDTIVHINALNASTGATNSSSPSPSLGKIDYVGYVAIPFFLITGLTGNTFTILIMSGKQFQKMTISTLLIALSVSDSLLVVMAPFNKKWFQQMIGVDVRSFSLFSCKVFFWFWRMAKMTSSWFVVIVAIERFIAVWFPLKVRTLCTKRNARIALALDYICIGAFNFAWVWVADNLTPSGTCSPNYAPSPEFKTVTVGFIWVGSFVYSVIPTAILLVLTSLIIGRLYSQRRVRRALSITSDKSQSSLKNKDNTNKSTALLLGVAIAFLVLVNPIATAHIVTVITDRKIFETDEPGFQVYREIASLLESANYSINFFIYVIWNQQYRQRFLSMVSCLVCKCTGKKFERENSASRTLQTGLSKGTATSEGDKRDHADSKEDAPKTQNSVNGDAGKLQATAIV
ncbi:QRFP-like peptide receptor [Lingula anatina]|uniref:QRFP-like peptide receptor n=1 Tax=Lingula anatina TaxID=7574 RepID=A0A1S3HZD9_LINAN|nr:QRFP-like peptide receptor [Lingula anatina]|eukprot:XP_013390936.1 QRFP-like peptide receptor [Lingula anatina]